MAQVLSSEARPATMRRSAFEVMMDILRVAAAGSAKPTHIMYKSNTSWTVLQKNLESLVVSGFMLQSGEGTRVEYSISPRGLEVLQAYNKLVERTNSCAVEIRS
jgi:predicted transcriptional regulator